MQQRSADTPERPDATVRIVLGDAGRPAPAPDATAVITDVDKDATTRLDVGDRTVRIPISPDDPWKPLFIVPGEPVTS